MRTDRATRIIMVAFAMLGLAIAAATLVASCGEETQPGIVCTHPTDPVTGQEHEKCTRVKDTYIQRMEIELSPSPR